MKRLKETGILLLLFFVVPITVNANQRQKIDFNSNWKFKSQIIDNSPSVATYNDATWEIVTIPHTWNSTDAQDGGNNYLRTVSWYRKNLPWSNDFVEKKVFIEFLGANKQAECFVNGVSVGTHKGGYTAFRFNITDQLTQGDNIIAVKVDNRHSEEIIPLSGDFSFFGGIYRKVSIIVTNPVHVNLMDNGAPGIYLTSSDVSQTSAKLEVKAKLINKSTVSQTVILKAELKNPNSFEEIDEIPNPTFNVNNMKPGGTVLQTVTETITIPAESTYEFKKQIIVSNPRLWDGKEDPFRYRIDFSVLQNGNVIDALTDYVGFRYFTATNNGFYLNGRLYPLRGVNRHQDRQDMGNAITESEHNEDFGMIYEMGANTIRLAHYPQDPYIYELCDRYGIVVWAEIPFVDVVGTAPDFNNITKNQLLELIRQQYNRPSICFWGLQNEVRGHYDSQMQVLMTELNNLAHAEDPSRLTVQATNHGTANNWASDLIAWNLYPGWYQGGSIGSILDGFKWASRPSGLSEYGAGGSIYQHEINPAQPSTTGPWHPEEYQSKLHEEAIIDISTRDFVWGTFLWNMFDFASDWRAEGDRHGVNDKGLVTYDRQVKKDSYYAYKVNWNSGPEIYIASRRFINRQESNTPVTVYSNCDTVELFVNGLSQGKIQYTNVQCGFFRWNDIFLNPGENEVVAIGKIGQTEYTDTVLWNRDISSSTGLISDELLIDNSNKEVVLLKNIHAEDIHQYITGVSGATFILVDEDGITPVTSGLVKVGMKIIVTSEDGTLQTTYIIVPPKHIASKKNVITDSEEMNNPAQNIVDGDTDTRWAANEGGAHWVEIDLEKEYVLNRISIQWYYPNTSRYYKYTVSAGDQKKMYATVVDRTNNTEGGIVTDAMNNTVGRYVKIQVTGASGGYPSIHEVEIYGWTVESTVYKIDLRNKAITISNENGNADMIQVSDFLSNIDFYGNQEHSVESTSYFIQGGDKLVITDSDGNETLFTISFIEEEPDPDPEDNVVSRNKTVWSSGEEGTSDQGETTITTYINDDNLNTRWAAPKRNGAASFPEWVMIDLGKQYNIHDVELYFYRYGENNRSYQYEVLFSDDNINFNIATDANSNYDKSGHYTHIYQNTTAHFVKVNVTGCSLNETWAAASINEMIVRKTTDLETSVLNGENVFYKISNQNTEVRIVLDNSISFSNLTVTDLSGRKILSFTFKDECVFQLNKGIYLFEINNNDRYISSLLKYVVK